MYVLQKPRNAPLAMSCASFMRFQPKAVGIFTYLQSSFSKKGPCRRADSSKVRFSSRGAGMPSGTGDDEHLLDGESAICLELPEPVEERFVVGFPFMIKADNRRATQPLNFIEHLRRHVAEFVSQCAGSGCSRLVVEGYCEGSGRWWSGTCSSGTRFCVWSQVWVLSQHGVAGAQTFTL
ncbi:hypothetical protein PG991_015846 [Apiospora marii]|uniref:Uncharacterized protein n=1 Tax=Apiospora marii TaxID=335849 RepID=A0ABR1R0R7_9PEZI